VETGNQAASACGFAADELAMPQLNRHIHQVPSRVRLLEQLLR
jgi:hypothetical protein